MRFSLTLLIIVFYIPIYAQTDSTIKPFFNQINISMNYGDVNRYNNNKNQVSLGFGIYRNSVLAKCLRIQWGFEYNELRQKGLMFANNWNTVYSQTYSNIHSTGVPINFQYLIDLKKVKLVPEIGFFGEHNFGHRINGKLWKLYGVDNIEAQEFQLSTSAPIHQFNYGLTAGIGINIPHDHLSYAFKLDYKYGIEDLGLGQYASPIYTRYFRLSAGIILHQRKAKLPNATAKDTSNRFFINEYSASINSNDIARYSDRINRTGYGIGIYHNSKVQRGLSTIAGIEVNQTKFYGDLRENNIRNRTHYGKMEAQVNFVTIPVAVRYHIGNRFSVFPEIGVYTDINTGAKGTGEHNTNGKVKNTTSDAEIKVINFGLSAGIGARIPVGKNSIVLKADYRYGLDDIGISGYTEKGLYNRYFRVSAGYSFAMQQRTINNRTLPFFHEFLISSNINDLERYIDTSSPQVKNQKGRIGLGAGAYHNKSISSNFEYQFGFEINEIRSKYEHSYSYSIATVYSKNSIQKINLNLANSLKYYLRNGVLQPFILIGAYPQLNIIHKIDFNSEFTMSDSSGLTVQSLSFTEIETFPSMRLGANAGVGLRLNANNLFYNLLIDYNYGGNGNLFELNSYTNRYIRLAFGLGLK